MALEMFKCDNCGAKLPPPPSSEKMVVCGFCNSAGSNPFYMAPTATTPAPTAVVAPTIASTPRTAEVPAPTNKRTAEDITRLAQTHLKMFDSLFYAPAVPPAKESGARKSYGTMIPANEPILVLYDSTVFGGADDGFVFTPVRLGWKNVAQSPQVVTWDALDLTTVRIHDNELKIMGDAIQLGDTEDLQQRLHQFFLSLASPSVRPTVAAKTTAPAKTAPRIVLPKSMTGGSEVVEKPTVKKPSFATAASALLRKEVASQENTEEEQIDAETIQSWIDDTTGFAVEFFRERDTLFVAPNIPRNQFRAACTTYEEALEENDTIVVLYDSSLGDNHHGFIATTWGFFWKNPDEDPQVVWWEELDVSTVERSEGVLTIEGQEVALNDSDRGLARDLQRFLEAMANWAQSE
jgi:hypothetical protein